MESEAWIKKGSLLFLVVCLLMHSRPSEAQVGGLGLTSSHCRSFLSRLLFCPARLIPQSLIPLLEGQCR